VAPPAADAQTIALLRRARASGVTLFDVARSRFPARSERLISAAFPVPDPELSAIVGPTHAPGISRSGREDGSTAQAASVTEVATSLEQSRRRLAPVPISIVDWGNEIDLELLGAELRRSSSERERVPLLWAHGLTSIRSADPPVGNVPVLYSGDLSLLDVDVVTLFETNAAMRESGLIARNPFSGGRLDGSRFSSPRGPGEPGEPPPNLREMHREFDPVLRLGFLTAGRRRTLAQAAVRFVLTWPWVATCVVPLPSPERFDEILTYRTTPALSESELGRLAHLK